MLIAIPREVHDGERRVAATPRSVRTLVEDGFEVRVESGAGERAGFPDQADIDAGATIAADPVSTWNGADLVLKVDPPERHPDLDRDEVELIRDACLIGFVWPSENEALVQHLAERDVSTVAMDRVPRITRAQRMDALSAMANAAGYRAVVEAAQHYPRFFAGQTTAAGTMPPARVLVIGAGVAGLAAIGAARGLGAQVRAFDTRPEVADQVRSMGAEFLDLKVPLDEDGTGEGGYAKPMSDEYIAAEMALFREQAREIDIIITTALIPGRPAPKLVTDDMVESMRPGSVIVDLAARQGGNCTLTVPEELVQRDGVTIVGYTDLPSRMAMQTSELYAATLLHMIDEMGGAEGFHVDPDNEVVRGALVTHEGRVLPPPPPPEPTPRPAPEPASAGSPTRETTTRDGKPQPPGSATGGRGTRSNAGSRSGLVWLGAAALLLLAAGGWAPESFLSHLTVFVLACFVGWQVVWNVTPSLHTPLMSVTNAVSAIIILGGILHLSGDFDAATLLGVAAVFLAAINVAGGFLVTRRMLAMFRR